MSDIKPWPVMRTPNIVKHGAVEAVAIVMMDERARAEAAMSRLRVAVKALKAVQLEKPNEYYYTEVDEALEQIGELPHD